MLRYFVCFYFTVNPGQIAMWDSGFLMEVYGSYRRAFCQRKIFPNVLSIAIQSRIVVNSCPRPDILALRPLASIDSADTVRRLISRMIVGPFIRGKIRRVLHKTRLKLDANCTIYTSMSYLIRRVLAKKNRVLF